MAGRFRPPDAADRDSSHVVSVALVDDHAIFLNSLAMALSDDPSFSVIGSAERLSDAERLLRTHPVDVLLLDHRLPDGTGIGAIPRLRQLCPDTHIIVLTAETSDDLLLAALEEGAAGFVSKTAGLTELKDAIHAVASGESVLSPGLLRRLVPRLSHRNRAARPELTEREMEVLELVAEGLSNAAIADRLVVSVHTIRNHVANLSSKLGAHSKLEALTIALREGVLPER